MSLEDDVVGLMESATDRRAVAAAVIRVVRAAVALEAAEERQKAEERVREERRERERVRKAEYRERVSRIVSGTDRDKAGQGGTRRDSVSPLDPPSPPGSSLSLLPDPERAIPGLPAFAVVGGKAKEWLASEQLLAKHQEAFPTVDVLAEYRKCQVYVDGNPAKRKTARGMPTALFRWLQIAVERGTAVKGHSTAANATGASPGGLATYCDWHKDARNDRKPSNRPKDTCPSCKHLKAASRPRESDTELALGVDR